MIHRKFGQTGVEVSALGMGCMRFERPNDVEGMAEVVYRAFERGVTYFDTAPYYCQDKSESILGTAVREMKKTGRPFTISTKSGEGEPAKIRANLERSLRRLNVDAIDFYHVWCLIDPDSLPERKAKGALDEFRKAKEEGLVRHISVSTHLGSAFIEPMLDQGEGLFETILVGLNATNFAMRLDGVRAAAKRGLGVATMNTLGGGLIPDHPDTYRFIQRDGDASILDAALRFNLSIPEVSTALVGFRNLADVDSAADAVERFEPIAADEIERLKTHIHAANEDLCTQCNYCDVCPEEIPVLRLMEAYNHRILSKNGPKAALDRLKWNWNILDPAGVLERCTECRQCEEACTQRLPILDRFEDLRQDQAGMAARRKKTR